MHERLGEILRQYEQRLRDLRRAVRHVPDIETALFHGFDDWERQLMFKLAPRLAGEGCLIIAVAGGTNTGKSTIFNGLLGQSLSPVSPYGAHTKHPVAVASPGRFEQALERGKLLPDAFVPEELNANVDAISDGAIEPMAVFVAEKKNLPDRMLLLDTPDIDSIVKENWELAKSIREAGDVLVAVLTAQKYADSVVVEFFREALKSGRLIIPVMNFADDTGCDYTVARRQLDEFSHYVGEHPPSLSPCFFLPRLHAADKKNPPQPVTLDEPHVSVMDYLQSLDAVSLKSQILSDSLKQFTGRADDFFQQADILAAALGQCIELVRNLAHEASAGYESRPGREMLTVVYDFIQKNASGPDRVLGVVTAKVVKVPGWIFSKTRLLFQRKAAAPMSEQDMDKEQRKKLEEILERLYTDYAQQGAAYFREYLPEAAAYFDQSLRQLDPAALAKTIASDTLRTEKYIGAYREYAYKELEARWSDRSFRWKVKLFYDMGLLGSWAGVLVLLWAKGWAPHLPLSEILASFGVPMIQHTVTHAALYLWGDKLSGLIDKWQNLQREALEQAIVAHLTEPALGALGGIRGALDENVRAMKELNSQCRQTD